MNTQTLLVCIPYCQKDVELARKLLNWIKQISPRLPPHCCLMAADSAVPHETKRELNAIAKGIFAMAETAIVNVPPDATRWPKTANAMFRIAALHIQECFRLPWFWMEPDCVPMRPSWLDELAVAYAQCPKQFMGAQIKSAQPPMPPMHLAGCAVYPPYTATLMGQFCAPNVELAWDIANASFVMPRSINTPLIHHHYGTIDLAPTFKAERDPADPVNVCQLDFVRSEAAVFHRCKDGTLIDLLVQQHNTDTVHNDSGPARKPKLK